ncbi:MAG: TetR/AcrR family transcriptional regulator [Geodermatophilaceae bacterium]|nr:TetR/AcrR family transcriptional regulator [Geodermatophilaceae bacterium]
MRSARTAAILQAAVTVLQDVGYDRLTMDAVAAQARAGKATLYRRWADKAALVAEAIEHVKIGSQAAVPDTGSLRGDLEAVIDRITMERTGEELCVMRSLATALSQDRRLAHLFHRTFLERRTRDMADLLRRAQQRGEIAAERDIEALAQVFPTMVFARSLSTSQPVERAWLDRLLNDVVMPAATAGVTTQTPHQKQKPEEEQP